MSAEGSDVASPTKSPLLPGGGDADTPGQPAPPPPPRRQGTTIRSGPSLCAPVYYLTGIPPQCAPNTESRPEGAVLGAEAVSGGAAGLQGRRGDGLWGSDGDLGGGGTRTLEVPPPCMLRAAPRTPRGADWCRGSRTRCRPHAPRRNSPAAPRWARPCARSCVGRGGGERHSLGSGRLSPPKPPSPCPQRPSGRTCAPWAGRCRLPASRCPRPLYP